MMLPSILTLVPQFVLIRNANLIDSYAGVTLPYSALGETISIFIMRGFFASLPEELFDVVQAEVFSSKLPSDPGLKVYMGHATIEDKTVPLRGFLGRPRLLAGIGAAR